MLTTTFSRGGYYGIHSLLEKMIVDSFPRGHRSDMLAICADLIPVQVTAASINIDLLKLQPASALPDISTQPESKDNGKCKI